VGSIPAVGTGSWRWDETLYAGSASHYGVGRMPYPAGLADAVSAELNLDGTGRLLDVGCGPGSLTLLLAPLFDAAVGVDADADMIHEAARAAREANVANIEWRHLRAEDLPADLGTFRVATFAQSFHWMDRLVVARRVRHMLDPGGWWVHVSAITDRGVAGDDELPHPRPPWQHIDALIAGYLGPVRRAGQGLLPGGPPGGEEEIMRQAGFTGPARIEVDAGPVAGRGIDEIVSAVFSLSNAAPHLFAERLPSFESDLRGLLSQASPSGRFAERRREIGVALWRP